MNSLKTFQANFLIHSPGFWDRPGIGYLLPDDPIKIFHNTLNCMRIYLKNYATTRIIIIC